MDGQMGTIELPPMLTRLIKTAITVIMV